MWSSRLITSMLFLLLSACGSRKNPQDDILYGTIAYPFAPTNPLGKNNVKDKFVIRSIVGNSEYVVEIPGAGEDYDIEIPLAALDPHGESASPKNLPPPATTDREIIAHFPKIEGKNHDKAQLADKAFGVGAANGPSQAPSYSLGIARVNQYYRKREFEYALVELNNLLSYFPNSPQLYKMKGTVLLKMHNPRLAEKAWNKALELIPDDRGLQQAAKQLRDQIRANTLSDTALNTPANAPTSADPTPAPMPMPASSPESAPMDEKSTNTLSEDESETSALP